MKAIKFLKLFGLVLIVTSCVHGDEFDVPQAFDPDEPEIVVNSSIGAVKEAYNQNYTNNNGTIYTFESNDLYFEGYVVSSDFAGNFYKSIIIQDKIENPTHGIEILVDKTSLFQTLEIGRKVYVKLDGLSVSYNDGYDKNPTDGTPGIYLLGINEGGEIGNIPSFNYTEYLIRSTESATISPKTISIADFDQDNSNLFVQIQNMQFEISELGKTYAGETNDEFDGMRRLVNCNDDLTATLQTSTFSDFKSHVIPSESGNINAILTKDFFGDFFVLVINDPTDVIFDSSERCDPQILDCGSIASGGTEVLFDEDFESTSETELEQNGWLNINTYGGSETFELKRSSGNSFMQASAYQSDENPMEVWLVTPEIDLSLTTDEELTFQTKAGYYDGAALSIYVSTDFAGDVKTATWIVVKAELPKGPSSGYGTTFTSSGSINLSCLEGNVVVAFKYLGADSGITTTFRIENVKVTGNL